MKYISLFSGIGGFEYGIQTSNKAQQLECIGYSEIDKYAENIYKKHYPNHPRLGDATQINTNELPNFDLLVGGFPCQAFSIAGKRKGFDDTRGTLFFEIARILKDKKPKYFLLENVKGLLSHDKGRTFQTILKTLAELGYNVEWQILNSKDYGVPQNRERIYIKGFSRERESGREVLLRPKICSEISSRESNTSLIKCGNVLPSGGQAGNVFDENGVACTLSANGGGMGGKTGLYCICEEPVIKCRGNIYPSGGQNGVVYDENGLVGSLGLSSGGKGGEGKKVLIHDDIESPKIKKIGNVSPTKHHGRDVYDTEGLCGTILARDYKDPKIIKDKMGDKIKVDLPGGSKCLVNKDDISCTLTAQGKQSKIHISEETRDNLCLRRLTPKECERLQGFPDDWTKKGFDGKTISDTQRYKCCGNAVTTTVIKAIFDYWDLRE